MNPLIFIMLIFALLGLFDKISGGKLGLSKDFDQGLTFMGSIALGLVGIYCLGIYFVQVNAETIAAISSYFPFDSSIFIGAILCPDLGGLPISLEIAETTALGLFSGALFSGSLGTVVSFQLPIFLAALNKEQMLEMMKGLILGIIVIPLGLFAGGLILGISLSLLFINLIPIVLICIFLAVCFIKANRITSLCMLRFGQFMQLLSYILFAVVMAGLFIPSLKIADDKLVNEAFITVAKMIVIICGSMVLSHIALIVCARPLHALSRLLRVNEVSIVGLILAMTSSIAMLPLFPQMNRRGKVINAAFSVSGAYVLGGQMAFVAGMTDSTGLTAYIVSKLVSGILAILVASLIKEEEPLDETAPEAL